METTKVWKVTPTVTSTDEVIRKAAALLKEKEVVAFPTETVYGLGADATNADAVRKIFAAKGRPSDNPLIVHVANKHQMNDLVTNISTVARELIDTFMPGPLTIVLPSNGAVSDLVTAGLSTVAIRMPDHPVALALLEACELPIAAPSANQSGKPSPTTADHVYQDLQNKIAAILDGGATGVGVESTVVDCTTELPVVLRPGGITVEQIEQVVGTVMVDSALTQAELKPKSPGMKYNHYQPEAPLFLVDGDAVFFQKQIDNEKQKGKKVGVIASSELAGSIQADTVQMCGSRHQLQEVAAQLYGSLRAFSKSDVDIILCETFPSDGIGQAIMNRLTKAAASITRSSD